jgi:Asp-tRNA(Asn)/Glu-tRNA(Gln) amidotransferase A subunit family amidase
MKVGILTETPYLPVSKAVKRAMSISRKALIKAGYQVVDINVDPKDYAEGRMLVLEMVINISAKLMFKSYDKAGETYDAGTAGFRFMIETGPIGHWIIDKILLLAGKNRDREVLKVLKYKSVDEYTDMVRRR